MQSHNAHSTKPIAPIPPYPSQGQELYPSIQEFSPQYVEAHPIEGKAEKKSPEEEGSDAKKCCLLACCVCICSALCILCFTKGRVGGEMYAPRRDEKRY